MSTPPFHLNLMRRRKQQYRLRRRRFLISNQDIFSPKLAVNGALAPGAAGGDPSESTRMREKLRTAEAQIAQLHADLRAGESLVADYEKRLAAKDEIIAQKDAVITEAKRVVDEAKAQILRNRQDVDIQRKRLTKEKEEMKKYAAEEVIRQILSPLDHFTLAVDQWKTGAGTGHSLGEGMQMVFRELMSSLETIGLLSINSTGMPFDPSIHDAVSKCEDLSRADGEVVRILRPGFRLKDKVLRPAIVEVNKRAAGVALPPAAPPPPTPQPDAPRSPDAVVEIRGHGKDAIPINPQLQDTHSSPLERARRMLESKFDDDDTDEQEAKK